MNDLAQRLCESAKATFYDPLKLELNEAASRIEKLEAALREIAALGYWDGDSAMKIAKEALEGKDD